MQSESNTARPSPGVSLLEAARSKEFVAYVGEWLLEAATISEQRRQRIDELQEAANEELGKRRELAVALKDAQAAIVALTKDWHRTREAMLVLAGYLDDLGVGLSPEAEAAIAMGRSVGARRKALLLDMDLSSGIVGFLLKITNLHSIIEAAENSHHLDESLWERLITRRQNLEILHSGRLNPDFRINSAQVQALMEFARRNYAAVCVDVSGNLERYSLEVMQESKQIFLVVTPEIPSLHLAREKLTFLQQLELAERVTVLLNRNHRRAIVALTKDWHRTREAMLVLAGYLDDLGVGLSPEAEAALGELYPDFLKESEKEREGATNA